MTVQRFIGIKGALALLAGGLLRLPARARRLVAARVPGASWPAGSGPTSCSRATAACARSGSSATCRTSSTSSPSRCAPVSATARALQRVAEALGGPVGEEMLTALRQMELGATRREAFLALRARNDSESLSTFVGAQLQAEELGVPLSEALNDIAQDMRRAAAQDARRRAARAAPRIADRDHADRPGRDDPDPRLDAPRLRHPRLGGPRGWLSGSARAARGARAAGSSRPAR